MTLEGREWHDNLKSWRCKSVDQKSSAANKICELVSYQAQNNKGLFWDGRRNSRGIVNLKWSQTWAELFALASQTLEE